MLDRGILYLSRADVDQIGRRDPGLYLAAVERALRLHAERSFVQPLKPYLRWRGDENHIADRIIAMPAYIGGDRPAAGLKWIGSKHDNPRARGIERASALTVLNDVDTHYPIAIMEGGLISNYRTAAVTAVAARHLALAGFASVACIGCGPIGQMQVSVLLQAFPHIRHVLLFDLDAAAAAKHASELQGAASNVTVTISGSPEGAVRGADVVVTATVAQRPYLPFEWLRPGAFVSNVSIMDVEPEVFLKVDKVVVDDWDQSNREKKVINQLVEAGLFSRQRLHAELGEIVAGQRPGRETGEETILLNPMGMAVEDIACARAIYDAAVAGGVGTWLSR